VTNAEKIARIQAWQDAGFVHPLTCGNNSNHRPLVPFDNGGQVLVHCLDCGYSQDRIPEVVLSDYVKENAQHFARDLRQ
jgi:Zn ribbon nucleic-acid-binding protein